MTPNSSSTSFTSNSKAMGVSLSGFDKIKSYRFDDFSRDFNWCNYSCSFTGVGMPSAR